MIIARGFRTEFSPNNLNVSKCWNMTGWTFANSGVAKQSHESEVHMGLIVTVK